MANSPCTYIHPTIKVEPQSHEVAIPCATMTLKQIEKCGWGPNCPICKNIEEDWDGNLQINSTLNRATFTLRHKVHSSHHRNISNAPGPKPQATTELPDLPIFWHTWSLCRTNTSKKRMGRKNGNTRWQIWTWLLFKLWVRIRPGWRRTKIWNFDMKIVKF